jgi:hypothetical protein
MLRLEENVFSGGKPAKSALCCLYSIGCYMELRGVRAAAPAPAVQRRVIVCVTPQPHRHLSQLISGTLGPTQKLLASSTPQQQRVQARYNNGRTAAEDEHLLEDDADQLDVYVSPYRSVIEEMEEG